MAGTDELIAANEDARGGAGSQRCGSRRSLPRPALTTSYGSMPGVAERSVWNP